jgi:hypothetical protein
MASPSLLTSSSSSSSPSLSPAPRFQPKNAAEIRRRVSSNQYDDINDWDISLITNMKGAFKYCYDFNVPALLWDVSHVTDMSLMFYSCVKFNGTLGTRNKDTDTEEITPWDTTRVTDMTAMFWGCVSLQHVQLQVPRVQKFIVG